MSQQGPEFDLPALNGGRAGLTELLVAGPVLLVFYKVTCPTCQLTLPFLERLYRGRTAGTPNVVAISQDDAQATTKFNQRYGITFPTLLDPQPQRYQVSNAYRIQNVPTLFLVEQDRRISQTFAGFDKAEIEALGRRFGVPVFNPGERIPVYQPG